MINNVIILALDKRRKLWEELEQQCLQKDWNVHKFIVGDGLDHSLNYSHIDDSAGEVPTSWQWGTGVGAERHYKALLSHIAILKYACKKRLDNFLLLEDDAYITDRFDEVVEDLDYDTSCDLLYLGWWAFEHENHMHAGMNLKIEEEYAKNKQSYTVIPKQCGGFHGVLINQTAYSTLLSFPPVAPMDSQCNMGRLNRLMVIPKIIHVRSTYSYCEDTHVERDKI